MIHDRSLLILASRSESRAAMLSSAGVSFEAIPASIDERMLETNFAGALPADIALALAEAKAKIISAQFPARLVLGSDSLVMVNGRRFDKPETREEAAEHLRIFSGKMMLLTSAATLFRDGVQQWSHIACAHLSVRVLSDEFLDKYLATEWPAVASCVGVFRFEGPGINLFERVDGDYHTILGMPLLPVLGALRALGLMVS